MAFVSAALKYGLPSINSAITKILTNVTEQSKVTKKNMSPASKRGKNRVRQGARIDLNLIGCKYMILTITGLCRRFHGLLKPVSAQRTLLSK